MDAPGINVPPNMSALLKMEARLSAALKGAVEELAHAECLDHEHRSEIYAILESLRTDTQAHHETVGRWINDITGEATDV